MCDVKKTFDREFILICTAVWFLFGWRAGAALFARSEPDVDVNNTAKHTTLVCPGKF